MNAEGNEQKLFRSSYQEQRNPRPFLFTTTTKII